MDAITERWETLATMLPLHRAEKIMEYVLFDEPEAVECLVDELFAARVPLADNVRAEIAVLAENRGRWSFLEDDLRGCVRDPAGSACVTLTPPTPFHRPKKALVTEPWLRCTTCDGVLHRVGDGSFGYVRYARRFTLTDPDGTRGFGDDQIWEAFATLHECCDDPDCVLAEPGGPPTNAGR